MQGFGTAKHEKTKELEKKLRSRATYHGSILAITSLEVDKVFGCVQDNVYSSQVRIRTVKGSDIIDLVIL